MKKLRTLITILFLSLILGGMTSCEITRHTDNGRHRGWFYKHNNHHQNKGNVLIIRTDKHQGRSHHNHGHNY